MVPIVILEGLNIFKENEFIDLMTNTWFNFFGV